MNSSVLPATTRVGVSNGLLDIGANNITIGALTFVNQANFTARSIPRPIRRHRRDRHRHAPRDGRHQRHGRHRRQLRHATRIADQSRSGRRHTDRARGLEWQFVDSALAAIHRRPLERFAAEDLRLHGEWRHGQPDGMALFGNNTYTGSTIFNGGPSIITGTNATTLVTIVGDRGPVAPAGTHFDPPRRERFPWIGHDHPGFRGRGIHHRQQRRHCRGQRHSHRSRGAEQQPHPRRCGDPAARRYFIYRGTGRNRRERDLRQPERPRRLTTSSPSLRMAPAGP